MATKSVLKQVNLNKKELVLGFLSALENAEKKSSKEVVISRTCTELREEDIKRMFGENK